MHNRMAKLVKVYSFHVNYAFGTLCTHVYLEPIQLYTGVIWTHSCIHGLYYQFLSWQLTLAEA